MHRAPWGPRIAFVTVSMLAAACQRETSSSDRSAPTPASTAQGGVAASPGSLAYRLLSPAPGDVLREGSRYTIRWAATRAGEVNVGVAVGGKDRGHLAMNLPAGTDSLEWQVPVGFVSGFGPVRSEAVRIRVENAADPSAGTTSEPFTIVGDSGG